MPQLLLDERLLDHVNSGQRTADFRETVALEQIDHLRQHPRAAAQLGPILGAVPCWQARIPEQLARAHKERADQEVANEIIAAHAREIAEMRQWLVRNPRGAKAPAQLCNERHSGH